MRDNRVLQAEQDAARLEREEEWALRDRAVASERGRVQKEHEEREKLREKEREKWEKEWKEDRERERTGWEQERVRTEKAWERERSGWERERTRMEKEWERQTHGWKQTKAKWKQEKMLKWDQKREGETGSGSESEVWEQPGGVLLENPIRKP